MGKGKKSKKRGGKKTSSAPSLENLCDEFANLMPNDEETKDLVEFERYRKARGEKMKEWRDIMTDMMSKEEHTKDLSEDEIQAAQFIMAWSTKIMAECGIVEEEKHSCLTYVEEHEKELFADKGAGYFEKMSKARIDAMMNDPVKKAEIKKLRNEGDILGSLCLMRSRMLAIDKEREDVRVRQGLPPGTRGGPFTDISFDDDLFAPPPPREDCPICFLPLPTNYTYQPCCGKNLCDGCIHAHRESNAIECFCPFCRASITLTDKESIKMLEKRLEANDSGAYYMTGLYYLRGEMGMKKDMGKALEHFERAAELGLNVAHHNLARFYADGIGLEKDEKKSMYHYRIAALGGMLESRHALGTRAYLAEKQNMELAIKHWTMAAELGHDDSLKAVKSCYSHGYVTKDVFAKALRAHKAATDELKSDQRDIAAKFHQENTNFWK